MLLRVGRCVRLSVKLVFTGKKGVNTFTTAPFTGRLVLLLGKKKCRRRSGTMTFTGHWVTFIVFYSNSVGASQFYEQSQRKRKTESMPHPSEADPRILLQETLPVVENWIVSSLV